MQSFNGGGGKTTRKGGSLAVAKEVLKSRELANFTKSHKVSSTSQRRSEGKGVKSKGVLEEMWNC